jgi:RNA polymerase sigma-70 factor (ECF subfamily)
VRNQSGSQAIQRQQVADLYCAERDGVYRSLIGVGLNRAKAEETTQEAFLRLYAELRNGLSVENPRAWVYRVAHNIGVDAVARQARESDLSDAMLASIPSSGRNAEEGLIEKEEIDNLRVAIRRLSKQQRLCLELRAQGLRYQDIAEVLQVRASTVGEFLRRALHHLKKGNS